MIADELQKTHSDAQPDPHFVTTLRSELIQKHPAAQGCVHTASKRKQSFLRYTVLLVACMVLIWMDSHFYDMETSQAEARAIISRMEQTSSLSSNGCDQLPSQNHLYRKESRWNGAAFGILSLVQNARPISTRNKGVAAPALPADDCSFRREILVIRFSSGSSSIDQMAQTALDRLAGPYLGMESLEELLCLIRMHTLYSYSVKRE